MKNTRKSFLDIRMFFANVFTTIFLLNVLFH